MMSPTIIHSIWITPKSKEPLKEVTCAIAEAEKGLRGDRYYYGLGSFSRWQRPNRHLSVIAKEDIDKAFEETGIDLNNGRHRRNIVTLNIDPRELIGSKFKIGEAEFLGLSSCPPCKILERLTEAGAFQAMRNRGGIRAAILKSGEVKKGDKIQILETKKKLP